jgi:hypothetical protein
VGFARRWPDAGELQGGEGFFVSVAVVVVFVAVGGGNEGIMVSAFREARGGSEDEFVLLPLLVVVLVVKWRILVWAGVFSSFAEM